MILFNPPDLGHESDDEKLTIYATPTAPSNNGPDEDDETTALA